MLVTVKNYNIMKQNTLLAFIGGALVGAAIALLYAPDKGSDTRKKIKNMAEKEFESIKNKIKNESGKEEPDNI